MIGLRMLSAAALAAASSFASAQITAPGSTTEPTLRDAHRLLYAQDERRESERRDEPRRDSERRDEARPEQRGQEERREAPRPEARRPPPPHFAQFRRGERLEAEYRHRNYVVSDWQAHHLHAPPRGYQWVEVGPDYLLVAIATGVIAEVLANGQQASAPPPGVPAPPPPAAGASTSVWYFCPSANAYYPYVSQCPAGWQVVPASPPAAGG